MKQSSLVYSTTNELNERATDNDDLIMEIQNDPKAYTQNMTQSFSY